MSSLVQRNCLMWIQRNCSVFLLELNWRVQLQRADRKSIKRAKVLCLKKPGHYAERKETFFFLVVWSNNSINNLNREQNKKI